MEMFMMFVKHHFLSMLVYLTILGIFLLNYFDKYYIKTCLYLTAISVVLDFIWVIAEADVVVVLFSLTGIRKDLPNILTFNPDS